MSEQGISRRVMLFYTGLGTVSLSLLASTIGFIRFLIPNAVYEPDRRFKVGLPEEIPLDGFVVKPDESVIIFRDVAGYHAISTTCTHLGCIVEKVGNGFDCPCHGSKFDEMGVPYAGPAPAPLPWYEIFLAPDGQLVVNLNKKVKVETKFRV